MTDEQLVALAKSGRFAAFDTLVARYENLLYSIAMGILRHREDAEDAVQNALTGAIEHLDGFRGEASFKTWITRITVNASLKNLRSRGRRAAISLAASTEDDGLIPHPDFIAEWRGEPSEILAGKELNRLLDSAITALPENYRMVFLLRDIEELSVAETAEILGISEANVKVRLLRARLALREKLTRVFGDEAGRLKPHDHAEEPSHASRTERIPDAYMKRSGKQ
ncbi:MAG TPA: sigma-70 family RNA polymerase sigma factor [Candidatus Brocadiia bacterium]|nr:sigma-70 family RNA polymerase sigma factor [Candidatus Brocadiia bacterium]